MSLYKEISHNLFGKIAHALSIVFLLAASTIFTASAQTDASTPNAPNIVEIIHIRNPATMQQLESMHRYVDELNVSSTYATSPPTLVVRGTPDRVALAHKLVDELDQPRKTYRLIYTLTEVDDGKRVGTQHFSMLLTAGQKTTMKQGSKIPVATGTLSENGGPTTQTQFTYLDVGLNFDATLDDSANGVRLSSKAEQSSLGTDKTIAGVQEPVVRQTVLEGTSILTPGKPLILGSLDIPDTTRRMDIEVVMDIVK